MAQPTLTDRTLVTGFGPFLRVVDNPSAKVAAALDRPHRILEVSFEAVESFLEELDPESFDRLMLIGVASGRTQVTPEIFARNHIGHTKDVRGIDRFGPIDEEAPLLLAGGLWGEESLTPLFPNAQLRVSMDAGSYLCNFTYFRALRRFPTKRIGFLHVPELSAVSLNDQIRLASKLVSHVETEPSEPIR